MPSGICRAVSYRIRGFRMVDKITVDPYGITNLSEEQFNLVEKIINESELEWNEGVLLQDEDSTIAPIEDNSIRSCKACFLPVRDELVDMFGQLIIDYNNNHSGWNYDVEFIEALQVCDYYEGDFYDWHTDSFANPSIQTKHQYHPDKPYNRKISATVFLNDPDEYEGGELDLETGGPNAEVRYDTMKMPKGTVVVFPSSMWHRVRPITSGVRKSLVLWIQGPPFV